MSEYQYYEFQAIDRPLTRSEMDELRRYSSRARITATSFVNEYNWGNFKGSPDIWMEKYFDAFVCVTNWGTRDLMFRLPKPLIDSEILEQYCTGSSVACRFKGEHAILLFSIEDECWEWEEGNGWLSSLIPLRSEIMNGDYRALYLGWLRDTQYGYFANHCEEPLVPSGLDSLSGAQQTLIEFLRIDQDWVAAAAEQKGAKVRAAPTRNDIEHWVKIMPLAEKNRLLSDLIASTDAHAGIALRRSALAEIKHEQSLRNAEKIMRPRSVAQLSARAEDIGEARRKQAAEARARLEAKLECERKESREQYLKSLVGREDEVWKEADALIASRQTHRYDRAVALLVDLRDLADITKMEPEFSARMEALRLKHARKYALVNRLKEAGLQGIFKTCHKTLMDSAHHGSEANSLLDKV